jgi:hypothetical protein
MALGAAGGPCGRGGAGFGALEAAARRETDALDGLARETGEDAVGE